MKRAISGLLVFVAAVTATSGYAIPITYHTDGDGLDLNGARVNGSFTYETDLSEMIDVQFNVTGAGSHSGIYSLIVHQYATGWVVAREDSSLANLDGAFALGFDIVDDLSAGGTVAGNMTALGFCMNLNCNTVSFREVPYQSFNPGSYSAAIPTDPSPQPDPISVPEPSALPLLATGLALLTLAGLRRRRSNAAI